MFISREQVNLSHVAQPSPFAIGGTGIGGRSSLVTAPSPLSSSFARVSIGDRSTTPSSPFVPGRRGTIQAVPEYFEPTGSTTRSLPLPWDTIEIPVIQRRANK